MALADGSLDKQPVTFNYMESIMPDEFLEQDQIIEPVAATDTGFKTASTIPSLRLDEQPAVFNPVNQTDEETPINWSDAIFEDHLVRKYPNLVSQDSLQRGYDAVNKRVDLLSKVNSTAEKEDGGAAPASNLPPGSFSVDGTQDEPKVKSPDGSSPQGGTPQVGVASNNGSTSTTSIEGSTSAAQPKETFNYGGKMYTRYNGKLYRVENVIPGRHTELSPDDAAGIDKGRAEAAHGKAEFSKQVREFGEGLDRMPEGNNPYEGLPYWGQKGRLFGSRVPVWDSGREAIDIAQGIYKKYQNGEPIPDHEINNLYDKGGKAIGEGIAAIGAIKGGKAAITKLK